MAIIWEPFGKKAVSSVFLGKMLSFSFFYLELLLKGILILFTRKYLPSDWHMNFSVILNIIFLGLYEDRNLK